ncbi:hypothetical protein [Streptomyces sp. NPDC005573]|uniref:hypothetical protein n=1 Tax=Streptomyces sp. NPDC005573 TaxID=3156890 RepID=UPI0033BCC541
MQRLVMIVGGFYSYAAHQITHAAPSHIMSIPGCTPDQYQELAEAEGDGEVEWSRSLLKHYVGVLQAAGALYAIRKGDSQFEAYADNFEAILITSVLGVYHVLVNHVDPQGNCRMGMEVEFLIRKILGHSLHIQELVFSWPMRPWSEEHTRGAFSSLKLPELHLLATRDESMKSRYGARRVEKIFEQQLALVVQSLGFYVVSTRTGEATVDLVCISSDPASPYTFLLEAKSSTHPYELPTDDRRALSEYIDDVRANLTTAPPLAFVLIVGGSAKEGIPAKLNRLELDSGVPIRFTSAQNLASLREALIGPTPATLLKKCILRAKGVVTTQEFQDIHKEVEARTAAQERLVRSFLSGAR